MCERCEETIEHSRVVEAPVSLADLVAIANLWGVPLEHVMIEETYEPGGSGCVEISYAAPEV